MDIFTSSTAVGVRGEDITTSCSFELDEEASETTGAVDGEGEATCVSEVVGMAGSRTGEGVGRTMVGMLRVGAGAESEDEESSEGFSKDGGGGGEGRRGWEEDASSGFDEGAEGDGSLVGKDMGGGSEGGGRSEVVVGLES